MADNKAGVSPPERRSLREIAKATSDPRVAAAEAKKEGHGTRAQIACKILCEELHTEGDRSMRKMTKNSGRANVAMLVIVTVLVGLGALVGCGKNMDEPRDWLEAIDGWFSYESSFDKDHKVQPSSPVAAPVQYWGKKDAPGFFNDTKIGLTASASSRTFFVNGADFVPVGQSGTISMRIPGVSNGDPIAMEKDSDFAGWWKKTFTATELPVANYDGIRFVRVENGLDIAEAKLTAKDTPFGEASISVRFDDRGNFYLSGSEFAAGVPGNTGDLNLTRMEIKSSAVGTQSVKLWIRTAGRKIRIVGSWDGNAQHDFGNGTSLAEDVNGWSGPLEFNDSAGNKALINGPMTATLFELDGGSTDTKVKGLLDTSSSKFSADLPVVGSASGTVEGLAFHLFDGVAFGNVATPPVLSKIVARPKTLTIGIDETFTASRLLGEYTGGWTASLTGAFGLSGASSNTTAITVSGLTFTGAAAGKSDLTFTMSGATSNVIPGEAVGDFVGWDPEFVGASEVNAGEPAQIAVKERFSAGDPVIVQADEIRSLDPTLAVATANGAISTIAEGKAYFQIVNRGETKSLVLTVKSHTTSVEVVVNPSTVAVDGEGTIVVRRKNKGRQDEVISHLSTTTYEVVLASDGTKSTALVVNPANVKGEVTFKVIAAVSVKVKATDSVSSKTGEAVVTLQPAPLLVEKPRLFKTTLNIGEPITAELTVVEAGGTTGPVNRASSATWSSSNTAIGTVDNTGKITAVAPGKFTVSALYLGIRRTSEEITVGRTLTGLTVAIEGGATDVNHDSTINYTLTAQYGTATDNVTQSSNASHQVTGSVSVPEKGKIKGDAGTGTGSVEFTYTEGGVSKSVTTPTLNLKPKVNTISTASPTLTVANTATAPAELAFVANLSDNTSPAASLTGVSVPQGAPFTATVSGDKLRVTPIANRSGTNIDVIVTGNGKTASVKVSVTAVLATIDSIAGFTLQIGTSKQLAAIKGKLNDSANSGGATSVTLAFDKVSLGASAPTIADINATGLVTADPANTGTSTVTVTSTEVTTVTKQFVVTVQTAPPPTVTSIAPASTTVAMKNTDTAKAVAVTVGKSDGSTGGAPAGVTVKSSPDFITVVMDATGMQITAKPNRSGTGNVVLTHADGVDSPAVAVTLSSVLASITAPANLTLQVGASQQLATLSGLMNDSANSAGATAVPSIAFDKVTMASQTPTAADINATGLVTVKAVGTSVITITSTEVTTVTQTFSVAVVAAPPANPVGTHGDPIIGGVLRIGFDGANPDNTSNTSFYAAQARVSGDKSKPVITVFWADRGVFQTIEGSAISVATASDGSLWWKITLQVRTSGEQFVLNYRGNKDTPGDASVWAQITGSSLWNFRDADGDSPPAFDAGEDNGLTPVVNPGAQTVTKGPMR